ncbi:hypothetical protein OA57_01645 [Chelonobacter oris]|uniref:Alpha/beta hydrolase n=1 Tax=Chelonobacter oris TaxID=505317 RepID=A0A0A3ANJ0_9PAST|nr:hypothetical protein [Chelonobacter oris]KGQ70978.1 hypothetical protein OA57_01645 [Chelonobacter oris]
MNVEFIEVENSTDLIIIFSSHNQPNFLGYKSLTNAMKNYPKISLLFLSDPENMYYLGFDGGKINKEIIRKYVNKFPPENITFFGSSMAGYAAIFFGSIFNGNIFASNPQINFGVTSALSWNTLRNNIARIPIKIDLDLHLNAFLNDSVIYIVHGLHRLDIANMGLLMTTPLRKSRIFIERIDDESHGFYLPSLIKLFEIHYVLILLRHKKITGINLIAQQNINKIISE